MTHVDTRDPRESAINSRVGPLQLEASVGMADLQAQSSKVALLCFVPHHFLSTVVFNEAFCGFLPALQLVHQYAPLPR